MLRFPEFIKEGDWVEDTLDNLADFRRGSFPQPYGLPKWYDEINGMPFIQVYDVGEDFKLKPQTKNKISKLAAEQSVFISKGTVIITIQGSIGRVAITQYDAYIDRTLLLFEEFHQEIDKTFFAYVLYLLFEIEKQKAPGGIIKTITKEVLSQFTVKLPKPKEQQKIASCLSSLDEVITSESQKLEVLKDHKKGLLQNLLPQAGETVPKFRFKEFENSGKWEEKSFEELFEIGNGRDYKHLESGNIPVYGSGGYMLSVNEFLYDGESVCIGRKGTIDKPMFLNGKFWTVDTLFYTHSFKECLPKYIFYVFQNINWRNHNEAGGVPSLSKTNIYKIKIHIPKPKEQEKIADTLSSIDDLMNAQNQKIEALQFHKKGLLQGLFPNINEVTA